MIEKLIGASQYYHDGLLTEKEFLWRVIEHLASDPEITEAQASWLAQAFRNQADIAAGLARITVVQHVG